jgi:hypothetical protein
MSTEASLIDEAREQYAELGTLDVTMYMRLNGAGLSASTLMAQFETEGETNNG